MAPSDTAQLPESLSKKSRTFRRKFTYETHPVCLAGECARCMGALTGPAQRCAGTRWAAVCDMVSGGCPGHSAMWSLRMQMLIRVEWPQHAILSPHSNHKPWVRSSYLECRYPPNGMASGRAEWVKLPTHLLVGPELDVWRLRSVPSVRTWLPLGVRGRARVCLCAKTAVKDRCSFLTNDMGRHPTAVAPPPPPLAHAQLCRSTNPTDRCFSDRRFVVKNATRHV